MGPLVLRGNVCIHPIQCSAQGILATSPGEAGDRRPASDGKRTRLNTPESRGRTSTTNANGTGLPHGNAASRDPGCEPASVICAANDWTVGLARRDPNRLSAFVAIDPLRPTALPEIRRWQGDPSVAGIKLHLTSSSVNLRKDSDLAALASVFRAAAQARFAIVIHLRTQQMDYGAADIRRFVEQVLPAARDTPVQIAHAAGWSGIDPATLSALGAFADEIEANPQRFRHVWFDLSGVWTDKTSASDKHALVALIRRIGVQHFLAASDWPYNGDNLADYYNRVYPELPLTQSEWTVIRGNVAPYAR